MLIPKMGALYADGTGNNLAKRFTIRSKPRQIVVAGLIKKKSVLESNKIYEYS